MLPSPARSSDNRSPSASRASLTIACGILTAKLFPHLATCVSFGIWIYIEYTAQLGSPVTGTGRIVAERQTDVPKDRQIVLYCGCCPWDHCPNIKPAFKLLQSMGFHQIKVLEIPTNFAQDWVDKGFPFEGSAPAK